MRVKAFNSPVAGALRTKIEHGSLFLGTTAMARASWTRSTKMIVLLIVEERIGIPFRNPENVSGDRRTVIRSVFIFQ